MIDGKETSVVTRETMARFYDGSLYDLVGRTPLSQSETISGFRVHVESSHGKHCELIAGRIHHPRDRKARQPADIREDRALNRQ